MIRNSTEDLHEKLNTQSSEYVAEITGTIQDEHGKNHDLKLEITLVLDGSSILVYKEITDGTGNSGTYIAPEETEHELEEISVDIANFINWRLTLS